MEKSVSSPVSIYALGGLGEVGKNMYCFETNNSIIIVDAGVKFPSSDLPGIDYIIPDFTHLKNNRNKIKALFITHGHEDHIGAIPFLIQSIHIPVIYAPRLACALIKNRLEENKLLTQVNIVEYDDLSTIKAGEFGVSFFRVTHSIPDSFGIIIDTPEGRIVTTGDFKIDLTPIGPDIDIAKMARLGSDGVDLLLSDSTNAENEGYTPSEKNVYDSIVDIFDEAQGRLIVSTFSSNISRIQQILDVAVKHNRKICIVGRSMEKAVEISRAFGYIKIPDDVIIQSCNIKNFRAKDLLIICTGSQGETMAALSRIASGEHKDVKIMPGDTVVFSSSAIPGNGIMIDHVINILTRCGAEVVTNSIVNDVHSSGHASKQEQRLVLKLLKPKYFMPVHGEYRMLKIHAETAMNLGIKESHCFILDNGQSLQLVNHKVTVSYPVESGVTYIDGKNINGLESAVINDRKILVEDGMMTIALSVDSKENILLVPPTIYSRGLINQGSQRSIDECSALVMDAVNAQLKKKTTFNDIKTVVKNVAGEYIYRRTNRHPMIIPVIMSKK